MNLSGILVVVAPAGVESAIQRLSTLPGVEVYHTDPENGRIVVVQEAEDVAAEVDGLKRIKSLPGITFAEMVYHYFEDDTEPLTEMPKELEQETEFYQEQVLNRLNR